MKNLFFTTLGFFALALMFSINIQSNSLVENSAFADTVNCCPEQEAICSAERVGGPTLRNYRPTSSQTDCDNDNNDLTLVP